MATAEERVEFALDLEQELRQGGCADCTVEVKGNDGTELEIRDPRDRENFYDSRRHAMRDVGFRCLKVHFLRSGKWQWAESRL